MSLFYRSGHFRNIRQTKLHKGFSKCRLKYYPAHWLAWTFTFPLIGFQKLMLFSRVSVSVKKQYCCKAQQIPFPVEKYPFVKLFLCFCFQHSRPCMHEVGIQEQAAVESSNCLSGKSPVSKPRIHLEPKFILKA